MELGAIVRCGRTWCGATKSRRVGRVREVVRRNAMKDKDNDHLRPSKVENGSETALLGVRRRRYGRCRRIRDRGNEVRPLNFDRPWWSRGDP